MILKGAGKAELFRAPFLDRRLPRISPDAGLQLRALAIKAPASSGRSPERRAQFVCWERWPYTGAQRADEWRVAGVCGAPCEAWHQHPFVAKAPVGSVLRPSKWLANGRSCSYGEQRYLRGVADRALRCPVMVTTLHAPPVCFTARAVIDESAKSDPNDVVEGRELVRLWDVRVSASLDQTLQLPLLTCR